MLSAAQASRYTYTHSPTHCHAVIDSFTDSFSFTHYCQTKSFTESGYQFILLQFGGDGDDLDAALRDLSMEQPQVTG